MKILVKVFFLIFVSFSSQIPLVNSISAAPERVGEFQTTTHYYVDAVNGNDLTGTGSLSFPWKTITYALSQTTGPDVEIHVAPGTYDQILGEIFPLSLEPGISIIGSSRDSVTISGQSGNPVISLDGSTTDIFSDTIISDITLQNGNAGLSIYATEQHTVALRVVNTRIRWNGDGIHMTTSDVYQNGAIITPIISNTEVISNNQTGIYMRAYGYFSPSSIAPTIINSTVQGNGSHGIHVEASAVSANRTSAIPEIIESRIMNNGAHGIFSTGTYQGWVQPKVERSWIENNLGYGFYWVQGINSGNITAAMTNTLFLANQSGGIYIGTRSSFSGSQGIPNQIQIINCTLVSNSNYGMYWNRGSYEVSPFVVNTILWNQGSDDLYSTGNAWTITQTQYSIIEDGDLVGLAENLDQDPLFVDSTNDNYELSIGSPAINAGDNTNCPLTDFNSLSRPQNAICEIGAFEIALTFLPIIIKE